MNEAYRQQLSLIAQLGLEVTRSAVAAGPQGLPSGPVYAQLMGVLDLDGYTKLINVLVETGLVLKKGDLLFAGPRSHVASPAPVAQ